MLRIGMVVNIPHVTQGGAWTLLENLVQAVKDIQSHHVFIWLDNEGWNAENGKTLEGEAKPVRYLARLCTKARAVWLGDKFLQCFGTDGNWDSQLYMEQWIRTQQIDIVWFLAPQGASVSVPYVTTVWDLAHRLQPFFPEVSVTGWTWESREKAYRVVLPRASLILTGTHAGKSEIVHYYGVNPDNVIVNPFPVPAFAAKYDGHTSVDVRRKYNIRNDFLIYPAQFWPHKNHINLLIALSILNQRSETLIEMVFTGSDKGNAEYVLRKIDELGLRDQVHVLGFVPREDLVALYCNALALTFASFFGPDNIPPLEAFALGCPVVASRGLGAEEQLGDAALTFNPSDPHDIASTILTILQDDQLRAQMVKKGIEIAKMRTPRAYVAKVCDVLDEFARIRRCWDREYKEVKAYR